ncbi:MAG: hypothetical protein A2516_11795 [Alphaproteobacteria bacterium RIFOXYD12_FULL_60_8]|nr:MAG: hypothetical protein A2516_11795 [Alphaproteobacteria bacterium RIFOXYD12_FULL_60_8]
MIKIEDFSPELKEAFDYLCSVVEPHAGFYPETYGQAITLFAQPYLDGVPGARNAEYLSELMDALRDIGLALHEELTDEPLGRDD